MQLSYFTSPKVDGNYKNFFYSNNVKIISQMRWRKSKKKVVMISFMRKIMREKIKYPGVRVGIFGIQNTIFSKIIPIIIFYSSGKIVSTKSLWKLPLTNTSTRIRWSWILVNMENIDTKLPMKCWEQLADEMKTEAS